MTVVKLVARRPLRPATSQASATAASTTPTAPTAIPAYPSALALETSLATALFTSSAVTVLASSLSRGCAT